MTRLFLTIPSGVALLPRPALILEVESLTHAAAIVAAAVRGGADCRLQVGKWLLLHPCPQSVPEHNHILLAVEDVEIAFRAVAAINVVFQPDLKTREAGGQGDIELQALRLWGGGGVIRA